MRDLPLLHRWLGGGPWDGSERRREGLKELDEDGKQGDVLGGEAGDDDPMSRSVERRNGGGGWSGWIDPASVRATMWISAQEAGEVVPRGRLASLKGTEVVREEQRSGSDDLGLRSDRRRWERRRRAEGGGLAGGFSGTGGDGENGRRHAVEVGAWSQSVFGGSSGERRRWHGRSGGGASEVGLRGRRAGGSEGR